MAAQVKAQGRYIKRRAVVRDNLAWVDTVAYRVTLDAFFQADGNAVETATRAFLCSITASATSRGSLSGIDVSTGTLSVGWMSASMCFSWHENEYHFAKVLGTKLFEQ